MLMESGFLPSPTAAFAAFAARAAAAAAAAPREEEDVDGSFARGSGSSATRAHGPPPFAERGRIWDALTLALVVLAFAVAAVVLADAGAVPA